MAQSDKHILILSSWYPSKSHPFLGNFVVRQIELLAQKYRVTVIHTVENSLIDSIRIEKTEHNGYLEITANFPRKKMLIQRKLKEKKAFQSALNELNQIDLIIGNVLLPKGWQFILAKRKYNCPLFYIEHGSYFRKGYPSWRKIDHVIKRKVEKLVDEVISVSEILKRDLREHFSQHDIKTIGNHTDPELFTYKAKDKSAIPTFLHVSTLDRNTKNPEGILEACQLLAKDGIEFKMNIVSDEDHSQLNVKVHEMQLQNKVTFSGPFSPQEIVSQYHNAHAFVLFSNYETFSIVITEAWFTGTPVISTPVGVAEEMSNELGILVEKNNPEVLAKAMRKMIEEPNYENEKIRDNAMQYSSDYILKKWTVLIDNYIG